MTMHSTASAALDHGRATKISSEERRDILPSAVPEQKLTPNTRVHSSPGSGAARRLSGAPRSRSFTSSLRHFVTAVSALLARISPPINAKAGMIFGDSADY
jgi:hypothetical protein